MNARRSRPMFPRFDHSTSRLFDQSTRLLPAASCFSAVVYRRVEGGLSVFCVSEPLPAAGCKLPALCGGGSLSALAVGNRGQWPEEGRRFSSVATVCAEAEVYSSNCDKCATSPPLQRRPNSQTFGLFDGFSRSAACG